MKAPKLLRIYLQDHDAFAYVTIQVTRRTKANNGSGSLGSFLDELDESAARHESLIHEVMGRVGVRPRRDKRAGVWVAERLGRLKLNGRLVRYSDLSRVFELEGLTALLTLRLSFLESLQALSHDDELLGEVSVAAAIEETKGQLEKLRDHRRASVPALTG